MVPDRFVPCVDSNGLGRWTSPSEAERARRRAFALAVPFRETRPRQASSIHRRGGRAAPQWLAWPLTFERGPFDQGANGRRNVCVFGVLPGDRECREHEHNGGQCDDE